MLTLVAAGVLAVGLAFLLDLVVPHLLEPVELWTVDRRFRGRPLIAVATDRTQVESDALAAVDFDDRTSRGDTPLSRWPQDRRVHVQLMDWIRQGGARTIVLDLLFTFRGRDPLDDQALADVSRRAGNVIHPFVFRPVPEREATPLFELYGTRHVFTADVRGSGQLPGVGELWLPLAFMLDNARGLGHIVRTPDRDGVLRRLPLLVAVKGGFVPSLALAAAFHHLDVDPASLRVERGRAIRFKRRNGDEITVPIDAHGRTWINYAGPWGTRFLHYPYSWVIDQLRTPDGAAQLPAWFRDRTVALMTFETAASDQGATPFDHISHLGEVHLHVLNMLFTRQFLRDATTLEAVLTTAAPAATLTAVAMLGGPALILPSFVAVVGIALLLVQRIFNAGVIVPVMPAALALTLTLVLVLAARFLIVDRERRRFQLALGACLPPQTVREIRESPDEVPRLLAGRRRELTILFADIRGFSGYCQRTDPVEIQRVLREYLKSMTEVFRSYGGTLGKYMGDGMMAFFGDAEPESGDDQDAEEARVERHAANAVRAGLAMQRKMAELSARWQRQGREAHQMRIGINTGVVTLGNLGTDKVWDYTVIGAEVNKAQRLEAAAEPGGLLLARRTYALARKEGALPSDLPSTSTRLRGLGEEPDLYAVSPELATTIALASPAPPSERPRFSFFGIRRLRRS